MTDRCPECGQLLPAAAAPVRSSALRRLRLATGYTMRELARAAGLGTQGTVWRMEHGHEVTLSAAVAIARALGVTVDEERDD